MLTRSLPLPFNSTNVRFSARRAGLRALSVLAPGTAETLALSLFATPRRRQPARPPEVPGLPAHRFVVRTAGPQLVAWDWGEGPTVLLAHGWNGHAGQMTGFVAPLVRAGFHVVAFDQPAHGQTPGKRANLLALQAAVAAMARRLAPVHAVVAHSLGAAGTALALARGMDVGRVVLLAPPAEGAPFARAFARGLGLGPRRAEGVVERMRLALGGDLEALDLRRLAPRMRARLLLVHDPEDPEVPFAHGREIAAAWPGAVLVRAPGLGHGRLLRDPGVIAAAVDFVSG
jgi:pimeloyl-ACP methyl ester carboxylesterase